MLSPYRLIMIKENCLDIEIRNGKNIIIAPKPYINMQAI